MNNSLTIDERFMREALAEARQALEHDEVPVGAVVVRGHEIIGRGFDQKNLLRDPTAHAEILALRAAARTLGDWRLENCTIYVTLEPCPMCAGAILLARVPRLVYGAPNRKFGACETVLRLLADQHGWNHRVEIVTQVLTDDCGKLLSNYFAQKRQKKD